VLKAKKNQKVGESDAKDPPPLPGLKLGLRRFSRNSDGITSGLASSDRKERDKWNARLAKIFASVGAPVVEGTSGEDPKLLIEMAVGRSRPSTVRLRVRSWEAFSRWLGLNRGRSWPQGPPDLIDYIKAMVDVPAPRSFPSSFSGSARWIMSRSGFEGTTETYEDPFLRRALQWAEAELVDEAVRVKKAPRMPIALLLRMELTVVNTDAPRVHRVFAWARLIKVYGGLRWDDLQRLRPADVELRVAGLVGRLTRTKTSGVGRRVRELPLFIPKETCLAATAWIEVGFHLWKEIFPLGRDYFLPRPLGDQDFDAKVATAGDAAAMGTALTAYLGVPVKVTEGDNVNKWKLSETALFPGALAAGWTNHSERATLTSALAAIGIPKEQRNLIGTGRLRRLRPDLQSSSTRPGCKIRKYRCCRPFLRGLRRGGRVRPGSAAHRRAGRRRSSSRGSSLQPEGPRRGHLKEDGGHRRACFSDRGSFVVSCGSARRGRGRGPFQDQVPHRVYAQPQMRPSASCRRLLEGATIVLRLLRVRRPGPPSSRGIQCRLPRVLARTERRGPGRSRRRGRHGELGHHDQYR